MDGRMWDVWLIVLLSSCACARARASVRLCGSNCLCPPMLALLSDNTLLLYNNASLKQSTSTSTSSTSSLTSKPELQLELDVLPLDKFVLDPTPPDVEGRLVPRSGLAARLDIRLVHRLADRLVVRLVTRES